MIKLGWPASPAGNHPGRIADGFILTSPLIPEGTEDFITQALPELRRGGLFRTKCEATPLPENLGLPRPQSRCAAAH